MRIGLLRLKSGSAAILIVGAMLVIALGFAAFQLTRTKSSNLSSSPSRLMNSPQLSSNNKELHNSGTPASQTADYSFPNSLSYAPTPGWTDHDFGTYKIAFKDEWKMKAGSSGKIWGNGPPFPDRTPRDPITQVDYLFDNVTKNVSLNAVFRKYEENLRYSPVGKESPLKILGVQSLTINGNNADLVIVKMEQTYSIGVFVQKNGDVYQYKLVVMEPFFNANKNDITIFISSFR